MPRPSRSATLSRVVPFVPIEERLLILRGERVILDADLAEMYGVTTKALKQAVRRNRDRFPEDFAFQLSAEEIARLRSQTVTSSANWGGPRYPPFAFSEQGVAMLSSVLRCSRAVLVNIEIMRTFVRLRRVLASHAELIGKLTELEQKYDAQFRVVFDAIRALMEPVEVEDAPVIGFRREGEP